MTQAPTRDRPRLAPGVDPRRRFRSRRLPSGPSGALLGLVALVVAWFCWRHLTAVAPTGRTWRTGPALALGTPLVAALMLLPGAAVLVALPERWRPGGPAGRFATVVAASGALWWIAMWCWVPDPSLGRGVGLGVLGLSGAVLGWTSPHAVRVLRAPLVAVGVAVGVTVAVNGGLYVHGGLGQGHHLASAVTYATPDNSFQMVWIQRLSGGDDLRAPEDIWPMADRPPVQAAMVITPVTAATNTAVGFQLASSLLQSLAAAAVALVLAVRGSRGRRLLAAVLLVTMTVWFAYGVVFVWPKLFAAALLLLAVALVLERGRELSGVEWSVIGALVALSVVAHPAGVLALPLLAGALVLPRDGATPMWQRVVRPRGRTWWALVLGGAVVAAPWGLYRALYDSSRSLLTAWHLTGVEDPQERRPLLQLLSDRLAALGVGGWLEQRWRNLSYLTGWELRDVDKPLWGRTITLGVWSPLWGGGLLGPMLPALAASWRSAPGRISSARLAACGAVPVVLWLCVEYGPPAAPAVSHHGPAAAFLLIAAAVAEVLATRLPRRWLAAAVAAQVGLFAVLWWPRGGRLECGELCAPTVLQPDVTFPTQVMWPTAIAAVLGAALLVASVLRLGGAADPASSRSTPQH